MKIRNTRPFRGFFQPAVRVPVYIKDHKQINALKEYSRCQYKDSGTETGGKGSTDPQNRRKLLYEYKRLSAVETTRHYRKTTIIA